MVEVLQLMQPLTECSSSFQLRSSTFVPRTAAAAAAVLRSSKPKQVQTTCMAHPRRRAMVAQQIRREVGDMLIKDNRVVHAIRPEAALGADMYLTSLTTISEVEVSRDLSVAKIFISIYGDQRGKEIAMEGLKTQAKYVRMQLGRRMRLRVTPEVRFIYDDSIERGTKVLKLLDKIKAEQEAKARGEPIDYGDTDYEDEQSDIQTDVAGSTGAGANDEDKMDIVDEEGSNQDEDDDERIVFVGDDDD